MQEINFHIIQNDLLEIFCKQVDENIKEDLYNLHDSELSIETFSFYTSVSAVFSAKIEGEEIELDSYIKHKRLGAHFLPDYTQKIDDLYDAYLFAQQTMLTVEAVEQTHSLITRNILQPPQRGAIRTGNMFVLTTDGKIEYVAAEPGKVKTEMQKLYCDIEMLLGAELDFKQVLFYASMIHLVFVKIHPFEDGNGRTARLLEKWFLAQKLGANAWFIESERYYYDQHPAYYKNIRQLGLEYDDLDFSKSLPFLLMLPSSLKESDGF